MKKPFKLPQAFLNQLQEFTKGYYLVTVNDKNEFDTFVHYPDSLTEMGVINYVDLQISTIQEVIRQQAVDRTTDTGEDELQS
jgi:hypothetical protein